MMWRPQAERKEHTRRDHGEQLLRHETPRRVLRSGVVLDHRPPPDSTLFRAVSREVHEGWGEDRGGATRPDRCTRVSL